MKATGILCFSLITLTGCVATNWQHTSITDSSTADRQLKVDDDYCTQAAYGSAPMPPIPASPPTTTFTTGQINVRNTTTGETTHGTYSATTVPSGGFAGGFANGVANSMSLGAYIRASKEQELAHTNCMYRKGWVKAEAGASHAASITALKHENTVVATASLSSTQIGPTNASTAVGTSSSSTISGGLVLTCRVGSALGTAADPGELFDYQMKIDGAKVWHGLFKKDIPLSTSENEYRWEVPLSVIKPSDISNLVIKGSINRYSGMYTEVLAGDQGVIPWSKGECKKIQKAF